MTTLTATAVTAQLFVTTYGVGNTQGFATGKWFDLADFIDKDDFLESAEEYAREVLGDSDPELCFSDCDFVGLPSGLYSEFNVNADIWDYLEMDSDDMELLNAYIECHGIHSFSGQSPSEILEEAQDRLCGQYDTPRDFAEEHVKTTMTDFDDLPSLVRDYIDYERVWEGELRHYHDFNNGYVFRGN